MDARGRHALRALTLVPLLLAGCATTPAPAAAPVPDALRAPAPQVLVTQLHASGVQIYECKASADDATRFEWAFRAPEADLLGPGGQVVGKHYAGPSWESSDGSKVVGTVVARDNGPEATAIPWLLLRATAATGRGMFGQVRSIQRLHTVGGKAPAGGCAATDGGKLLRVPYTADYLFYR